MTPIRNITDAERSLATEREEYKAHAQRLMTLILARNAEIVALRAELADRAEAAEPIVRREDLSAHHVYCRTVTEDA